MELRIKTILKERGISHQELADRMGTSLQNVRQMVNKPSLTTATLERIAEVLSVPVWQLFVSAEDAAGQVDAGGGGCRCPHCGRVVKVRLE